MEPSEHWEARVGGLSVWPLLSGALPLGPHHTFHLLSVEVHYLLFPQAMWEPSADTLAFPVDDLVR